MLTKNSNKKVVGCRLSVVGLQSGVATLPTIMVITVLILTIGIAITSMGLTDSIISAGQKQSAEALVFAEAGAKDALVKIARDKNFSAVSPYQINLVENGCATGEGCAMITVSAGTGSPADPKITESEGRVKQNIRKIRVKVYYDSALNGEIQNAEWSEI